MLFFSFLFLFAFPFSSGIHAEEKSSGMEGAEIFLKLMDKMAVDDEKNPKLMVMWFPSEMFQEVIKQSAAPDKKDDASQLEMQAFVELTDMLAVYMFFSQDKMKLDTDKAALANDAGFTAKPLPFLSRLFSQGMNEGKEDGTFKDSTALIFPAVSSGKFLMDEKAKTITLTVWESGKEKKFLFSLSFENGKPVIKSQSSGFMPFLMKLLESQKGK